jgi:general secretion pathway protein G
MSVRLGSPEKKKALRHRHQAGFTLLELLIVVVILGLLATLVGPKLFSVFGKAKRQIAKTQIEQIATGLDLFRLDLGRYPTTDEGLEALVNPPEGLERWNGPYMEKGIPKDPWDRPYVYVSPGEHGAYDIISLGLDGEPGGEGENADITSWQ